MTGSTCPRRLRTPRTAGGAPGTGADCPSSATSRTCPTGRAKLSSPTRKRTWMLMLSLLVTTGRPSVVQPYAGERALELGHELVHAFGVTTRSACSAASRSAASRTCTIAAATWSAADFCCCVARMDSSSISAVERHQLADLARLPRALLGGHDRRVRLVLDRGDDLADRIGRADGALGQLAHLARDDRESAAGIPRARRLDGGVEREQICLLGDVVDQLQDLADLLRAIAERERAFGNRLDLGAHVVHRLAGSLGDLGDRPHVVGERRRRRGQLFDRCRALRHRGGLLAGRRHRLPRCRP